VDEYAMPVLDGSQMVEQCLNSSDVLNGGGVLKGGWLFELGVVLKCGVVWLVV